MLWEAFREAEDNRDPTRNPLAGVNTRLEGSRVTLWVV